MNPKYFRIGIFSVSVLLAACVYSYFAAGAHQPMPTTVAAINTRDPQSLLDEARRLAWLGNWEASAPLFAAAEVEFHRRKDERNAIYAQVGYLRATVESRPYPEVSAVMADLLRSPIVLKDSRLHLWCLSVKGYADLNRDTRIAKETWTDAYQIASSLNDQDWIARTMGELGIIDYLSGNRQRAVVRVGNAILSARKSHDVDSEIRYLSMLGDGFVEERRYWFAQLFLEHAMHLAESTPDVGFPFLAYQGQAAALLGSGDYRKARTLLETSLRKAREQHRPGQEGLTLLLLGNSANKMGDGTLAKEHWNDAIAVLTHIHAYRPLAQALFNLAMLQRKEGDLAAATKLLTEGVAYSRQIGDRIYYPRDLTALGEVAALRGRFQEAEKWYRLAEQSFEELSLHMNTSFGEAGFAEARSQTYVEHFALLHKQGRVPEAFQVIERVRGLATLERQRRALPFNSTPEMATLEKSVAATQLALLRTAGLEQKSNLINQLAEQERELALVEDELKLNDLAPKSKPLSLRDMQKVLRKDELLLEYVLGEAESSCIAITRESVEIVALDASRAKLENLVAAELKGIRDKRTGNQEARALYDLLLRPMEKFQKPRIVISSDGALHHLPFEALIDDHENYATNSLTISYVNSASELRLLRGSTIPRANEPLLAVGGVSYGYLRISNGRAEIKEPSIAGALTRGFAELAGSGLHDLPYSAEEVSSIARIAGPRAIVLHNTGATETAFKAQPLAQYQVIHFAVHAISDSHYPERAALVLGAEPGNDDDGLLQAREIIHLSLNADLVTLSGCSTGLGTLREEAGVESLENAFMMAGAKAVVASFWDVQDRSTTTLMEMFYRRLASGEDKAQALTDAKRDFLIQFGNVSPYYWAGFFLVGESSMPVAWGGLAQQSTIPTASISH